MSLFVSATIPPYYRLLYTDIFLVSKLIPCYWWRLADSHYLKGNLGMLVNRPRVQISRRSLSMVLQGATGLLLVNLGIGGLAIVGEEIFDLGEVTLLTSKHITHRYNALYYNKAMLRIQ